VNSVRPEVKIGSGKFKIELIGQEEPTQVPIAGRLTNPLATDAIKTHQIAHPYGRKVYFVYLPQMVGYCDQVFLNL
jgi:hypothetical protein